ncbi:MAG TPA: glucose 1-dehydrogenase [Chryseolinea sp.]
MKNLNGKIAIVTGGNSGIGYAAAKALKENGAQVIITGRRKEAVEKAASQLGVEALVADQSSIEDIHALVAAVAKRSGTVDILVVNAGITQLTDIEHAPEKVFDDIMGVNLRGTYFTLSKFIPVLNEGASVILLSSTTAHTNKPYTSIYCASKAAVNAVMKIAAVELAPRKIRVNAVSPGPIATELMEKGTMNDPKLQELIVSGVPLGRLGKPEEVGNLISYLAGSDASFITGSEFIIDGGQVLNK